ncbi:MAG: hypothetical protein A2057_13795 [Ignavibacteria bacterium GWA2_35_9]|nr:MAG: hypothetical protein A2057_13795 [Ignavibacteria bacterium GWA2_35_9]OGU47300.1 MAG: hypothetical protein A2000_04135 [Ignavibacteria bacterium GWB2_36_8]OGU52075.1 MAG: hypothetical protein A2080_02585 [Ignavibacteria bacterium GWC2_36_12]
MRIEKYMFLSPRFTKQLHKRIILYINVSKFSLTWHINSMSVKTDENFFDSLKIFSSNKKFNLNFSEIFPKFATLFPRQKKNFSKSLVTIFLIHFFY